MTKHLLLELLAKWDILNLILHLLTSSLMWFTLLFAGFRILKVKVKLNYSIFGVFLLACNSLFLRPFTSGIFTFFTMLIPVFLILKFYSKSKWTISFFITAILIISTAVFPMLFIIPLTSSNHALISFFKSQYGIMVGSLTETLGIVVLLALLNIFNVATVPTPGQTVLIDIFIFSGLSLLCYYEFAKIWEKPDQFLILPCIAFLVSAALAVAYYIKKVNDKKTIEIMNQDYQELNKKYQSLKNLCDPDIPDFGDKLDMYFTQREQEVLQLLAQGMDNSKIAENLHLAMGSVTNRVSKLKEKIELDSRDQLTLFAIAWVNKFRNSRKKN